MIERSSTDRALNNPRQSESEGRVLPFRPRGSLFARTQRPTPVEDLRKYERIADEPDDYIHRMKMNALAALVAILLIVGGLWIADVMAQMRKNQDCVLSGRRDCTPVDVPLQPR
jgi:hypothetical protein